MAFSSSSDEEILDIVNILARPRLYLRRRNVLMMYSDSEFKDRFRLHKDTFMRLVEVIGNNLRPVTNRSFPLSPIEQILITIRFYATGSYQIVIGDWNGVHKSTVCRIIKKVTHEIASLRPTYVKMPESRNELLRVKEGFFSMSGFPNVLGCVDGSHIPVQSPRKDMGELYRNRKGFFSINVQVVCDHLLKIRDIVARSPGSFHDSTMFNNSHIRARFEAQEFEGTLLGDSAYPCRSYLMTPFLNPNTEGEERYNHAHIRTRVSVEHTFGVWKRRFPCLSLGLRVKLQRALAVIVATAVLHNLAIDEHGQEFDFEDIPVPEENNIHLPLPDNGSGNAVRRTLVTTFFRILAAPFFHVGFADFWLADQLNSLVTACLDYHFLICFYINNGDWLTIRTDIGECTQDSLLSRSIVNCLPAWFRFAQCLRRYRDTREAFPHLVNAGKYSTTFLVVIFAALRSSYKDNYETIFDNPYFYMWVLASVVSSIYAYTWDIKMDWGLFDKSAGENKFLREETVYSSTTFYYFAIVEDFVLRFAWIASFIITESRLATSDLVTSVLAPLEVFRRFVWNFFRLENEHLNNCGKFRAVRDISVAPIDSSDQAQILRMMDDEDGVVNRHKKKTGKKKEDTKLLMPECSEPSSFLEVP